MNQTLTAVSHEKDTEAAVKEIGAAVRGAFKGAPADAVVVFASAQHDFGRLLTGLANACGTDRIMGASSAGEFSHSTRGEGSVSVLALRSDDMRFRIGLGENLSVNPGLAAREVARSFAGITDSPLPYRAALVMTDALAGHTDAVVDELTLATGGEYRFFGGGAGDDGKFHKTHVFAGTKAVSNAVVALEILSSKPLGVGVSHGWTPAGKAMRVTEAEGNRVVSLNGVPAVELIEEHARQTAQRFDRADPLPFFLHNILGIEAGGQYRLRVPLGVESDGSLVCAAAIPQGSVIHVMKTSAESAVTAAQQATRSALDALAGARPGAAFVFDCVATRLRMGNAFDDELRSCADILHPAGFVGCNTYGQIARAEGQFGGFHNCTAVVCVLPE
ncbi:MAG TPA: FIST N-terminal domain-containing protein [Usitatibacter sp.]|nr:FIST N-terminal domain-containing protein [Usitatibacter sp.]